MRGFEKHLAELGYQEKDYKENHVIEPKTVINKDYFLTQYMVVFKDDPDVTYYYGKNKKTGKIVQFCEKDELSVTNDGKTKYNEPHCDFGLKNRD